MKHLFIPYELAVIAKEKGFNEPCLAYYVETKENNLSFFAKLAIPNMLTNSYQDSIKDKTILNITCAPLYQQIVDWLREEHEIDIVIVPDSSSDGRIKMRTYSACLVQNANGVIHHLTLRDKNTKIIIYSDYNNAFNKAIEEALKLIP